MQKNKNPLFIVLGVCGGCALIAIIAFAVIGYLGYSKGKGLIQGAVQMTTNMPKFLQDVKSKNYSAASTLMEPSARQTFTPDKIQQMEEAVEKKLGPLQSVPQAFTNQQQSTNTDTSKPGQMPSAEYTYTWNLNYKKGTATATFTFVMTDILHPSGLITDFKLEPDK